MAETTNKCFVCGTVSKERPLLKCEHDNEEGYVCVACLPALIHGRH